MSRKSIIILAILVVLIALFVYFTSNKQVQAPQIPLANNNIVPTPEPSTLSTQYITNLDVWPPVLIVKSGIYTCMKGGNMLTTEGSTIEKQINGRTYCITITSEGAAGSRYDNYTYTTKVGTSIAKSSFVIRSVQCMNYDEPKQTECKNEQSSFNPDIVIDSVVNNYIKTQSTTPPSEVPVVTIGTVSGHITIGPFCPVQIEGKPCPVPPEAYSSRKVIIYASDGTTIKQKAAIDSKGDYKVSLASGTYFLQVDPAGIGPGEKKKVVVIANKTSTIDFDIDTGMR